MREEGHTERLNVALEGRYRIERQLGEGGMATVYLARDLKHNRNVALKVLKPEFAAVVGAARFLAEIETTANLQHPHILPLFDSGEAGGFLFYVMPYVEGESLRERLDREHQLPVDEAVQIAKDVAEALQAAHDQGVIHRDVKPANILLSKGRPLVSDFGIALALGAAGAGRLTETGLSLGTPRYMSPEQATGDVSVGPAADVWALGCVLYEMLVGEPPYTGSTPQAILGKIVLGDADPVTNHRRSVPLHVEAAIRKALEKVPADRFTSAYDFVKGLEDRGFRHGEPAETSTSERRTFWQLAAVFAVGLGVGAVAGVRAIGGPREAVPGDVMRFAISSPQNAPINLGGNLRVGQPLGGGQHSLAISRDGRLIVYQTVTVAGNYVLNVRPIDQLESTPLRGTEGGAAPFFSPDGEWVGFIGGPRGVLLKVPVVGGPPMTLTEPPYAMGFSWGADDRIVMGSANAGLWSVPGDGGEPQPLTTLDKEQGELAHVGPHVVDGEDVVLFTIRTANPGDPAFGGSLAALDLASGEVSRLGLLGDSPRYTSTGHVVYLALDGTLQAVPFDIDRLTVTGSPVPLIENIGSQASGQANFDISRNGRLVYLTGSSGTRSAPTDLVLVDRDGGRSVLAELESFGWWPRLSEDGARIAYAVSQEDGSADLWVLDVARGAQTRVTFEGNNRFYPIWSPDGTRLIHADSPGTENRLVSTAADGSGGREVILDLGGRRFPTSWSPDGRTLAYYIGPQGTPTNTRDLWMLSVDGRELRPEPYVETPFEERGAIFSPDGRWVAYVSDRGGPNDVYAASFPGPGAEVTVSVGGGSEPVWSPSGRDLYYRTDTELMVVSVDPDSPSLSVGSPRRVMADHFRRDTGGAAGGMANYDVTPDGESFVMIEDTATEGQAAQPVIHVVLNWFEELRARVPTN